MFFGRDAQIVRALDMLRGMRTTGVDSLFVVLGPSGSGKSSFLRAGLLPRLRREDRHFVLLDIMRPERHALTGDTGLAHAICAGRRRLGLEQPALGDIEIACTTDPAAVRTLLAECRHAAAQRVPDAGPDAPPPTLVLPLDQAEELFTADAGPEAAAFLRLIAELAQPDADGQRLGLIVAGTIRTDRYEVMQTAPQLAELTSEVFDDLKPMPDNQFRDVITGPADRASAGGSPVGHRSRSGRPAARRRRRGWGRAAAAGVDAAPALRPIRHHRRADPRQLSGDGRHGAGGANRRRRGAFRRSGATQRLNWRRCGRRSSRGWPPSTPTTTNPCAGSPGMPTCPSPAGALIEAFVEKRLLVKDQRGDEVVVEVALESLLRQWNDLAGWLREERQSLIAADDIERAATAWRTHHDDPAWLLTGTRLADAETLAAEPGYHDRLAQQPTRDYLAASPPSRKPAAQAEEERRKSNPPSRSSGTPAQERQQAAEAHAADLRRRSRILRAVLAGTADRRRHRRRSVPSWPWSGSTGPPGKRATRWPPNSTPKPRRYFPGVTADVMTFTRSRRPWPRNDCGPIPPPAAARSTPPPPR